MKIKHLLISIAVLLISAIAFGQTPLPNDPETRVGKLENGLTYYIRHNDKPAQRAEFWLATDVGAFQEEDHQDGLAHFLEHMCFNGTKNFPNKDLLNYLQSIGAEFGRNINASTGFEVTQYMLNNIPITRETIIDSCLLILHDYSHYVTCDPKEIDNERGVILEERRTRRTADWRMLEQTLPYYFGEINGKRTLIGGEEQLKTFKPSSLVEFYKKWYNPDMQAVIVVGDIDVDKVEQKIKDIFGSIPAPETPTVKTLHKVPDNAEPQVAIITDPEASSSSVEVLWRSEPLPKELNNTDVAFMLNTIKSYVRLIMRERFTDITSQPNAPFLSGSLGIGSLMKTADAVMANVSFKDGEAIPALTSFMLEIEKMKRFGFTDAEVERAKQNILSSYEKAAEAASTRQHSDFVRPILSNFYDNASFMTPEMELQIAQAVTAQLNAQILNQVAASLITDENMVVIFNGPEKAGLENPTEAQILEVLSAVKVADIEANTEDVSDEPLLDESKLKGSKVTKTTEGLYGSTVWTLKNGMKVIVKPTEYKKDEIRINVYHQGGRNLISTEDLNSFESNIWATYMNTAGISKFPKTTLRKLLSGKILNVTPFIGSTQHGVNVTSTPKDLETALQLLYLYYADPRFDADEFEAGMQQIKALLPNLANNPQFQLQVEMNKTLYGGNERSKLISEELLEKVSLDTIEKNYRNLFRNAREMTVVVTGMVDLETLKPMVEKYLGSIEKGKKRKVTIQTPEIVKGEVINHFHIPMQTPKSTVFQVYSAYLPVDVKLEATLDAANYILDMVYVETIREDEGGTYSPQAVIMTDKDPKDEALIQVYVDTNEELAPRINQLAIDGLKKLATEGPTAEQLAKAIENLKKNVPESRIRNSYWLGCLKDHEIYGYDKDKEYEAAIDKISAEDIKTALQSILEQGNYIEMIMYPQK